MRNSIIYAIFIVCLINFAFPQSNRELESILKKSGISKSQAEKLIRDRLPANMPSNQNSSSKGTKPNVDIKSIERSISNDVVVNSDVVVKPIWDPPVVAYDKHINTTYNFEGNSYLWNGQRWVLIEDVKEEKKGLSYFGYDALSSDADIFQESSFSSIDPSHVIGPGDEIVIMLWGQTELNMPYIVSNEGYIFVDNLGQVFVNGLNRAELEQKLFNLLKKVYSSLDNTSAKASTFLDVSLGATVLRPIRIFVIGDIEQAGAYNVNSSATLFSSLYYFGGPDVKGSLRNIELLRNNKSVGKIDFYDYLLTGKKSNDKRLQRNDVVFIPKRGKTVSVFGEIENNAIFELKGREGLRDLIKMAGGVKASTYLERVQIQRIISPEKRKEGGSRKIIDLNLKKVLNNKENFSLNDGDIITFFKFDDRVVNKVQIIGPVLMQGDYSITRGMKISALIDKAGGLGGDSYLKKANLTRTSDDGSKILIDINLQKALNGDPDNDILIENRDVLQIYRNASMVWKNKVFIEGHVFNPGSKDFKSNMTLFDLIFEGGGFENEIHLKKTYLERADLQRLDKDGINYTLTPFRLDSVLVGSGMADEIIKMGDKITVYSKNDIEGKLIKQVKIEGFVKNPGQYPLFKDMKLLDLIFLGGVVDDPDHQSKVYMDRVDIVRKSRTNRMPEIIRLNLGNILKGILPSSNIELIDGDVIRVYSKEVFKSLNFVEINGFVLNPGKYDLKKDMKLADLILEAGGLSGFSPMYRAEIASISESELNNNKKTKNNIYADIKTIDLKSNLDQFSKGKGDILLKPYDIVTLRKDPEFELLKTVSVQGEVLYPGDYVIKNSDDTIADMVERAGGVKFGANPRASKFTRDGESINLSFDRLLKNKRSKSNINVRDGDIITIGKSFGIISIEGEVYNPGVYQYISGQNFAKYIENAGGFTKNAERFSSYVEHADGTTDRIKLTKLSPKVYDGSKVVIIRKGDEIPFNFTEYVTNLTSIWADITQAYLIVLTATRL